MCSELGGVEECRRNRRNRRWEPASSTVQLSYCSHRAVSACRATEFSLPNKPDASGVKNYPVTDHAASHIDERKMSTQTDSVVLASRNADVVLSDVDWRLCLMLSTSSIEKSYTRFVTILDDARYPMCAPYFRSRLSRLSSTRSS